MKNKEEIWTKDKIRRRTFFSFTAFLLTSTSGFLAWKWFRNLPKTDNRLAKPTRDILTFNEKVNGEFFSVKHLAPTYEKSSAVFRPRITGEIGLKEKIVLEEWKIEVINPTSAESLFFDMNAIKLLPKEDIIFDFKCIEGWNEIVHYGGIKFSDFLTTNELGKNKNGEYFKYVGLETPNGKYYVGLDMKSVLHPQTLLCYEMNGKPLTQAHGFPLRLIMPVKYGVKNLKRIGKIIFSDTPPKDYWHQDGYDYDAAL